MRQMILFDFVQAIYKKSEIVIRRSMQTSVSQNEPSPLRVRLLLYFEVNVNNIQA